jgi:hypothetical protein
MWFLSGKGFYKSECKLDKSETVYLEYTLTRRQDLSLNCVRLEPVYNYLDKYI